MDATPDAAPAKRSALPWLIGCSAAIVLTGLLCIGGSWFAINSGMDALIEASHEGLVTMVEESQLPSDQVDSVKMDLDRLREAALAREIDLERLEGLEGEFKRTISLGFVQWYEIEVIASVQFEEDERLAAQRVMERLARGIQEGAIDLEDVDLNVKIDEETMENGYDPAEVRADIDRVRAKVDEAGIPDEPFQVDVAEEFARLVDGIVQH